MGELESLLLVLGVIYLTECLVWVRLNAVALTTYWKPSAKVVHPPTLASNQRGGFVLALPLPPFGSVFISQLWPVSLAPEAAYSYVAACLSPGGRPRQTGLFKRWDDCCSVATDGKKILVNGELFLQTSSPPFAQHIAQLLHRLHKTPFAEREAALRKAMSATLNAKEIAARLEAFQKHSKPVGFLVNSLFLYLFLLAPCLVWQYGLRHLLWAVLLTLLAHTITIAILFHRAHKSLFPSASEERLTPFLIMLLAPPSAIRALDTLSRHLFENFHPLAVAQALCAQETFKAFARQVLLDLRYPAFPISPTSDSVLVATEQWSRAAWLEALEDFIRRAGLKPEELAAPPAPYDADSRSYCPRCGAQFVVPDAICSDCGGRPTFAFSRQHSSAMGKKGINP